MVGLTGLQNAGGGSIAVSNALPNTPFLSAGASVGTGVGSLGEFGGYIPTPLPQFTNYTDYLAAMPGASQMDAFANIPITPGYYQYNTQSAAGYQQDIANNMFQHGALSGAMDASTMALGGSWQEVPMQEDVPGPNGTVIQQTAQMPMWVPDPNNPNAGFIKGEWMPAAHQMFQQANQLWGLEPQLIQQAFDPQNALYGRTQQQLQDQTRAGLAARGLSMDPYGAGVEGSTMSNFNIDWQNAQLQRMLQGAQGINQLAQGGGALSQAGATLEDTAAQEMSNFARLPMDTWNNIINTQWDALQRLGEYGQEAAAPFQKAFSNWQDIQNQFLAANQQSFNQNQISGFEDPFSLLQLQTQTEMEREQMQQQEEMQKRQMAMQGAGMGMSALGGMKGGI